MKLPALTLTLFFVAASADAQDDAVRRTLIRQAARARDVGDHVQALALAQEAAARHMTPSLRTFIAQEYAALGQDAAALAQATACVREVEGAPGLTNHDTLLRECRELVVRLTPPPPPATPPPTQSPPPTTQPPPPTDPPPPITATPTRTAPLPTLPTTTAGPGPWIVAGAGALSFALAGVFYGLREGALDDRATRCAGTPCLLDTQGAVDDARTAQSRADTFNTLTNVALGVGGAALAGGALWYVLTRVAPRRVPPVAWTVSPGARGLWIGVGGSL